MPSAPFISAANYKSASQRLSVGYYRRIWLFCRQGFFSVVADRDHPDQVLVRGRAQSDLQALAAEISGEVNIWEDPQADYHWRMRLDRQQLATVLSSIAMELDYDNFKNAIAADNQQRAMTYAGVWQQLLMIEEERDD